MITYHQLQTFLMVARTGSLTKAARELDATQPTVSLQLHALRKFLGTPLFERPGGRFRLTPAGERLRRYAEEAVGGLRSLQQDVAALKGSLAGPLAVGLTYVMNRYVLPPTLSRFVEQFSGVEVQLYVEFPEPMFSGLLRNMTSLVGRPVTRVQRHPRTPSTLCVPIEAGSANRYFLVLWSGIVDHRCVHRKGQLTQSVNPCPTTAPRLSTAVQYTGDHALSAGPSSSL